MMQKTPKNLRLLIKLSKQFWLILSFSLFYFFLGFWFLTVLIRKECIAIAPLLCGGYLWKPLFKGIIAFTHFPPRSVLTAHDNPHYPCLSIRNCLWGLKFDKFNEHIHEWLLLNLFINVNKIKREFDADLWPRRQSARSSLAGYSGKLISMS